MHDGAVELVEVGQLVEERGDGGVGRIGHGRWPIRYAALHDRTRLARPAHLQRGREPRHRRRRRPSRAGRGRTRGLPRARRRRRLARRHRAPWPTSWPRRTPARSRCCTGPCARGWVPRTWPASRARCRPAPATCSRWTPTSPTTRRTSRACSSAVRDDGADLALGSRYVPGGGVADWGAIRRIVSRGGSWYARRTLGLQVRDLTGGFKCFRADVLREIDLPSVRSRGYAFQVELTYRAHRARAARGRGADRLPRPRAGDVEDVLADHRRGGVARAAAAPGRRAPPTSGRGPSSGRHRRAESTQGERQRARPRPGHG